jgi:hypothetical protein
VQLRAYPERMALLRVSEDATFLKSSNSFQICARHATS